MLRDEGPSDKAVASGSTKQWGCSGSVGREVRQRDQLSDSSNRRGAEPTDLLDLALVGLGLTFDLHLSVVHDGTGHCNTVRDVKQGCQRWTNTSVLG